MSLITPLVTVLVLAPSAIMEIGLGRSVIVPAGRPGFIVTVVLPKGVGDPP